MGSDHAPVVADMLDIHPHTGVELSHVLGPIRTVDGKLPDPPPLCTVNWVEFSGKQAKLSSFFSRQPKAAGDSHPDPRSSDVLIATSSSQHSTQPASCLKRKSSSPDTINSNNNTKAITSAKRKKDGIAAQQSISYFFNKPDVSSNDSGQSLQSSALAQSSRPSDNATIGYLDAPAVSSPLSLSHHETDMDAFIPPEELEVSSDIMGEEFVIKPNTTTTVNAWSALFAKPDIPKCLHNESCTEYRVNKPGPNHGRCVVPARLQM